MRDRFYVGARQEYWLMTTPRRRQIPRCVTTASPVSPSCVAMRPRCVPSASQAFPSRPWSSGHVSQNASAQIEAIAFLFLFYFF